MTATKPVIRWINDEPTATDEVQQVVDISRRCFGPSVGLTADTVRQYMDTTLYIPKVITDGEKVVGYLFYKLHKHLVSIEHMAVDPDHCRQGYGKRLVAHMKHVLNQIRRPLISVLVPEHAVAAQLFFKSQKFEYKETVGKGTPNEAYLFTLQVQLRD